MNKPIKILVVDDDAQIRSTLKTRLESMGFEVSTAADALTALVTLAQTNPRLIITDCDMGTGPSGLHLTKKIRQMGSKCPIVMYSGNNAAQDVFETMAGGTKFFLKTEVKELLAFVAVQAAYDFKVERANGQS